jgi:adenylate kinase family enzyme
MRRIAVLGCAGSGKTTLSRALGARLGLPVIHVDTLYWRTGPESGSEWPPLHEELIAGDAWVFDGMKPGVLAERLARADTAIFLDLPRWACYRGVAERRLTLRGRSLPEAGAFDRIERALLRWIWRFPRDVRPGVLEQLRACTCDVVVLRSRGDVRRFLDGVPSAGHGASAAAAGVAAAVGSSIDAES